MGTPDWKAVAKNEKTNCENKEKEIQLLTSNLLVMSENGKAMMHELKKLVDIAEELEKQLNSFKNNGEVVATWIKMYKMCKSRQDLTGELDEHTCKLTDNGCESATCPLLK